MAGKGAVFEPKVPEGHVCNVTPNGKTYDYGDQGLFSNGLAGQGCFHTTQVGTKTIERPPANQNRSGERYR